MANGLYCNETAVLPVTPKYRHDSNSENTPPTSRPLESTPISNSITSTSLYPDSMYSHKELIQHQRTADLLCREILEEGQELPKEVVLRAWHSDSAPSHLPAHQNTMSYRYQSEELLTSFNHPPVKADCDSILLKDDRVLQNLLRNEDR